MIDRLKDALRKAFGVPSPIAALHEPGAMRLAVERFQEMAPRVREALDLIERETREQERAERQAACDHGNATVADDSSYGNPRDRVRICPACEWTEYFQEQP